MRLRTRAALRYAPSGLLRVRGIEDSPPSRVGAPAACPEPVEGPYRGTAGSASAPPSPCYCPTPRSFGPSVRGRHAGLDLPGVEDVAEEIDQDLGAEQAGGAAGIVFRRQFDEIDADDLAAHRRRLQEIAGLVIEEAAGAGRAGAGHQRRIEAVDIDGEIEPGVFPGFVRQCRRCRFRGNPGPKGCRTWRLLHRRNPTARWSPCCGCPDG